MYMKKSIALIVAILFFILNLGYVATSHAEVVTQKIASEAAAKELAANAGGEYVSGSTVPAVTGTQVALPIISEATGKAVGYIVADKAALISALNAAGYTEVASAIAASEAGTAAGFAVGSGVRGGTIALGTVIAAGIAALIVSSSGDGNGTGTTAHH